MLRTVLAHLRAQWIGVLALLIALGTGSAYAANTVFSSDIVNNQVFPVDVRDDTLPGGGLGASDIATGAVQSGEVRNNQIRSVDVSDDTLADGGLTGKDIADQSGVDTCTHGTIRIGELCVHNTDSNSQWLGAHQLCDSIELRVPTLGEALVAANHTIPNLDPDERFWTEEFYTVAGTGTGFFALAVTGVGPAIEVQSTSTAEVVCVTTPTN